MHRLQLRLGALAALPAVALLAPAVAHGQATATAIVSSTASGGMQYAGTDGPNTVKVTLSGTTFTIDDVGPVRATAGCAAVANDATRATCTAFKNPDGSFKRFHIFTRGGQDRVTNSTAVPMNAHGESGRDTLEGGSGADLLNGGLGDGDELRGGAGADVLDGGPGARDAVTYSERLTGVSVSLDGVANDGKWIPGQGESDEHDNAMTTVEDISATNADDLLFGNDAPNVIAAGAGNDVMAGGRGADTLLGGKGSDVLLSNFELFGPLDDGAVDQLFADPLGPDPGAIDTCGGSTADGDIRTGCEQ